MRKIAEKFGLEKREKEKREGRKRNEKKEREREKLRFSRLSTGRWKERRRRRKRRKQKKNVLSFFLVSKNSWENGIRYHYKTPAIAIAIAMSYELYTARACK